MYLKIFGQKSLPQLESIHHTIRCVRIPHIISHVVVIILVPIVAVLHRCAGFVRRHFFIAPFFILIVRIVLVTLTIVMAVLDALSWWLDVSAGRRVVGWRVDVPSLWYCTAERTSVLEGEGPCLKRERDVRFVFKYSGNWLETELRKFDWGSAASEWAESTYIQS